LRVEEVDRILFAGLYIKEATTIQGKEGEGCTNCEVHLRGQDTTAQKDVVAIAQGPEDVDTCAWNTCIDDTSEESWLLVDGMSCDETAKRVSHDYGTSLLLRYTRLVAW
jgi:hypothetical protein